MAYHGLPDSEPGDQPAEHASLRDAEAVVRPFVEHWGAMARSWGINATMGELFALLYLTGEDWDAEGLRRCLGVSRGNVSMNLRELMAWGVVHKVHRDGERREFYRAEGDVWTLFRRILRERKRRELDPTLAVLDASARDGAIGLGHPVMERRLVEIRRFFALVDAVANQVLDLEADDLDGLARLIGGDGPG